MRCVKYVPSPEPGIVWQLERFEGKIVNQPVGLKSPSESTVKYPRVTTLWESEKTSGWAMLEASQQ